MKQAHSPRGDRDHTGVYTYTYMYIETKYFNFLFTGPQAASYQVSSSREMSWGHVPRDWLWRPVGASSSHSSADSCPGIEQSLPPRVTELRLQMPHVPAVRRL